MGNVGGEGWYRGKVGRWRAAVIGVVKGRRGVPGRAGGSMQGSLDVGGVRYGKTRTVVRESQVLRVGPAVGRRGLPGRWWVAGRVLLGPSV